MNLLENTVSNWNVKELIWLLSCIIVTIVTATISDSSLLILIYSIIGITNLILAAKGKIINYIFGLVGAILYAVISYQNGVYGQLLLAVFFLCPIQFYGWYNWTRPQNNTKAQQIKIKKLTLPQFVKIMILIIIISAIYLKLRTFILTSNF